MKYLIPTLLTLLLILPAKVKVEEPKNNSFVYDAAYFGELEEVSLWLLDSLEIRDVYVHIVPMTDYKDRYFGYVEGRGKQYLIHINDELPHYQKIETLCHEIIHIQQMNSGALEDKGLFFIWEGRMYSYFHPYDEREWEIEAKLLGVAIARKHLRNERRKFNK